MALTNSFADVRDCHKRYLNKVNGHMGRNAGRYALVPVTGQIRLFWDNEALSEEVVRLGMRGKVCTTYVIPDGLDVNVERDRVLDEVGRLNELIEKERGRNRSTHF